MNQINISDEYCNKVILDRMHMLAHDLRGPLRSINGIFQLLLKGNQERFDEESMQYIEVINNNIKFFNDFVFNTLKNAECMHKNRITTLIDPQKLLQDIRDILYIQLKETKGLIEICQDFPLVIGNITQIRQVFTNLIDNAIKYRSSEPPLIRISFVEKDRFIEFSVSDNGIGITPQEQKGIFEKFKRLNMEESIKGSGIGLWMCKKIVESHDGMIQVCSKPEGGTLFTFSLPKSYK